MCNDTFVFYDSENNSIFLWYDAAIKIDGCVLLGEL